MRRPATYPVLLAVTNVIYAIPALDPVRRCMSPWLGFTNDKPIVVAMTLYTLVILVRNIVEGIRAVPEPVLRAADGMGYRSFRRFAAVELPLALPGIVAGLRLATVSTVSLISVGAIIGRGGLGRMFADGYERRINIEIWAGAGRDDGAGARARPRSSTPPAGGPRPWARARRGERRSRVKHDPRRRRSG